MIGLVGLLSPNYMSGEVEAGPYKSIIQNFLGLDMALPDTLKMADFGLFRYLGALYPDSFSFGLFRYSEALYSELFLFGLLKAILVVFFGEFFFDSSGSLYSRSSGNLSIKIIKRFD